MSVENVQVAGGNDSVTHSILLIKETGISALLNIIPAAPLINDKSDIVIGIVSVHNFPVTGEESVHIKRL